MVVVVRPRDGLVQHGYHHRTGRDRPVRDTEGGPRVNFCIAGGLDHRRDGVAMEVVAGALRVWPIRL